MSLFFLWILIFLSICVITDLLYAKVFNQYIIGSFIISVAVLSFSTSTISHWSYPLLSFLLIFTSGILLFKFKVLGGGDIKAMLVASIFLTPHQAMMFLCYSIIWGGVFSLVYFMARGTLYNLVFTTAAVMKKSAYAVHKIPFTVGILLGWLSLNVMGLL